MNKTKKRYPLDFKKEVLQFLDAHPEMSHREVADTFGLERDMVSTWNRKMNPIERSMTSDSEEIRGYQKEMARLREENEILKKALAIFSGQKK
jgi:transposase